MGDWIYFVVGLAVLLTLGLLFVMAKHLKEKRKTLIVSAISIVFIIAGLSLGLWLNGNDFKSIVLYDTGVLISYFLVLCLMYFWSRKNKPRLSTRMTSFLGIIIGMSSVLMILGFSIIPGYYFLKVEFSALVIFMTLLWFDLKTAVIVSLLTNIMHFLMPGTPPLIPFLDEMVNFLATMLFILPTAIFLKKNKLDEKRSHLTILIFSIIGVASTTILMLLFNQYINLPLIYKINMSFRDVLIVFGVFNLIKWGLNAVLINLTWKRFYMLRSFLMYKDIK